MEKTARNQRLAIKRCSAAVFENDGPRFPVPCVGDEIDERHVWRLFKERLVRNLKCFLVPCVAVVLRDLWAMPGYHVRLRTNRTHTTSPMTCFAYLEAARRAELSLSSEPCALADRLAAEVGWPMRAGIRASRNIGQPAAHPYHVATHGFQRFSTRGRKCDQALALWAQRGGEWVLSSRPAQARRDRSQFRAALVSAVICKRSRP